MKKSSQLYGIIYILFICSCLTGCSTKNVISSLQYREEINMHVPKAAYIYWVPGKQVAHEKPAVDAVGSATDSGLAGLIGTLVVSTIQNQHRKSNPSRYTLEYGKADEAVFITSLRNALDQQGVFKSVELTTDPSKINSNDVLIKIYFKTTRVIFSSTGYLITLSVNLSIKNGHKHLYERTYLAQNDNSSDGFFKSKSFLEKKTEVSQELLAFVIKGIKQWHEESK